MDDCSDQVEEKCRGHKSYAITASFGLLDEIHQHYVPGRTPDALDVAADLAGALIGIWLKHTISGLRARPQERRPGA